MTTSTNRLNTLLRGELSAVETYDQALSKLGDEVGAAQLRHIQAEHRDAAEALRRHIYDHGGDPDATSGMWGAFAQFVEGTASIFGRTAALKALKEGEEHGIKLYEAAIEDAECPQDCRTLIVAQLLPQTRTHVPVLDRLMAGLVERISADEAHRRVAAGAFLVCAYDSPEKYRQYCLDGSMSLDAFRIRATSIFKDQEIIFYCS